ncbi:hypothetical protein VYU27_010448, partial [Nannochloropsis oceanica]
MNRLATSSTCLLARRCSRSSGSSSSRLAAGGRRRPISSTTKTPSTTAGLGGGGGQKKRGLFDRSIKEHYLENKKALDGVGLSFLFFYLSGHAFMQKQRADEIEEELAVLQTEMKTLKHNLKDEKWAKAGKNLLKNEFPEGD